uniref:Secreted protein n=1 Tax=Heterorhabditis bacteriophora TaxID=37862 RepID=A0A1I7X3G3_HETBA
MKLSVACLLCVISVAWGFSFDEKIKSVKISPPLVNNGELYESAIPLLKDPSVGTIDLQRLSDHLVRVVSANYLMRRLPPASNCSCAMSAKAPMLAHLHITHSHDWITFHTPNNTGSQEDGCCLYNSLTSCFFNVFRMLLNSGSIWVSIHPNLTGLVPFPMFPHADVVYLVATVYSVDGFFPITSPTESKLAARSKMSVRDNPMSTSCVD